MIRSFVILSIRSIFRLCFYMLSLLYLLQNCPKWRHNSRTCLWWGQKETNCSSDKTWILTQVSLHRVLLQEVNKQIIWQRYCPGDSFKYVINMSENPVCFNTLVFSTNQALQSPENTLIFGWPLVLMLDGLSEECRNDREELFSLQG